MFRTELPLTPHPQQLPLSANVLTVGSCFSDTIGSRLAASKVNTLINPFGTVFNPLSACQLLRAAAGEEMDWQQHLVEARGRWQSYDLHASIGADSPVTLLQHIQGLVEEVGKFLHRTDVVVLTLGTAYAYRLLETDAIVNNCHKVPAERFEKVLLTPDEIINAVAETHAYLRRANPNLRFILTVSPVRHLKETLPLNSVSKSVLRVACHYLSELLPGVSYFPAYELLVDDLRDYRFYAADMLHPSEVAENYIWERFTRTYFDSAFGRFRKEWESVRQALGHRPLYPEAPEHREFLEATLARLQRLAGQADMRSELQQLEQQLAALPMSKPQPEAEPEPDDDEERIDIGEAEHADLPLLEAAAAPVDRPTTAATAIAPVEMAAEAEEDEDDSDEEPDTALENEAALPAKKKRRSRGGAKRTARKRAAQLAAQLAAEAPAYTSSLEISSEPLENVESQTSAELQPLVEASVSAPALLEVAVAEVPPAPVPIQPEIAVPAQAAPVKPTSPPVAPKPNIDWLQPMDEPDEAPAPQSRGQKAAGRSKGTRAAVEKKPRVTKDRIITTPPRSSRKKLPTLYAEPEAAAAPAVPETIAPAPVVALQEPAAEIRVAEASATENVTPTVAETPLPVAKEPVAAVVPEVTPFEAPAVEVLTATEVTPPKKPRQPRPKAAPKPKAPKAAAAATPEPPQVEEPAPVAPKKRSRPPRKKPGAADGTPAAS